MVYTPVAVDILGRMDLHDKTEAREERERKEYIVLLDNVLVAKSSFKLYSLAVLRVHLEKAYIVETG